MTLVRSRPDCPGCGQPRQVCGGGHTPGSLVDIPGGPVVQKPANRVYRVTVGGKVQRLKLNDEDARAWGDAAVPDDDPATDEHTAAPVSSKQRAPRNKQRVTRPTKDGDE